MATKAKPRSRILEAVHETAGDLHRLGFSDKRKMQRYEALCPEPVPGACARIRCREDPRSARKAASEPDRPSRSSEYEPVNGAEVGNR